MQRRMVIVQRRLCAEVVRAGCVQSCVALRAISTRPSTYTPAVRPWPPNPVQSRANTRHMQRRRTDARCGSPLARSARPLERCGRPDGAAGRAGRPGARKAALTRPHRALLTRLSHDPCPCHLASRPRPTLEKYSPFLVRRPLVLRSDLLISVIASTEIGALSTGSTQLTDHTLPTPLCTNC